MTLPEMGTVLRSFVYAFLKRAPPEIALKSVLQSPVGVGVATGAAGAASAGGGGGPSA